VQPSKSFKVQGGGGGSNQNHIFWLPYSIKNELIIYFHILCYIKVTILIQVLSFIFKIIKKRIGLIFIFYFLIFCILSVYVHIICKYRSSPSLLLISPFYPYFISIILFFSKKVDTLPQPPADAHGGPTPPCGWPNRLKTHPYLGLQGLIAKTASCCSRASN
jgi:hypothetical protein